MENECDKRALQDYKYEKSGKSLKYLMSVKLNFILLKKIPKIKELRIWINWLNDFEVVKYSEQRFKEHTIKTQKFF